MDPNKWVRIISSDHTPRINIDEVWYPSYSCCGWQTVSNDTVVPISDLQFYKFRCRQRDVLPGMQTIYPGDYHELVNPWEYMPVGDEEYWDETTKKWMPRVLPQKQMLLDDIYRRPIIKDAQPDPKSITVPLTDREHEVLLKLSEVLELQPDRVIIMALRHYQRIVDPIIYRQPQKVKESK